MCRVKLLLVTLCISSLMLTIAGAADKSLILYLPLDEGQGRTAMDASDYQNPGEVIGNAAWVQGKIGMALEIVAGSHVVIPEIPEYDVTSEVTLMTWMRTTDVTTWARLIDKSQWQTTGYDLVLNQGSHVPMLEFFVNNTTSQVMATTPVDDNEWHFIAGTFGNKTLRIYVDGIQEGEVGSAGGVDINPNDWPVMIGAESSSNGGQQYVGTVDEVAMFNRELTADEIQDIFVNGMVKPELACEPQPRDEAVDVYRDAVLSWKPGEFADTHDVYFGTDFNDVNDATIADPRGVTISRGQIANTYDTGRLEFGQTYYWRVDEVSAPPDNTIYKGNVWRFKVEFLAYQILGENISTSASSSDPDKGPENTINGSGLDESGLLHGNISVDTMWLSSQIGDQPTWIEYEFDKVYKLHEMWVWNSNDSLEPVIGLGFKDVSIEYSVNGFDYTTLETVHEFDRAPGSANYAHNTTVDFNDIAVKYVRLTANSNWEGILNQFGLSEVRFFHIPVHASGPEPDSGAVDIALDVILNWRAGREAAEYNLYFSDDEQAVIDGTAPVINLSQTVYGPMSLDLGKTYYWRVDEVNNINPDSVWVGAIWSFTTADNIVVDDFETYNDLNEDEPGSNRIYNAWIDGYDNPAINGSVVGYANPPFAERTIVHGGSQSMPFEYDNAVGKSEATLTLTYPTDWTESGVSTLVIWYIGDAANASEPMYVALNDTAVVTHDNPGAARNTSWTQWAIDLTRFADQGVNLANINTITIGFGNRNNPVAGGSGMMYFDDIRLYAPVP